jgi:hypothetical protein
MRIWVGFLLVAGLFLPAAAVAAPKTHVAVFGKWMPVKLFVGPNQDHTLDIKVRPLYVDGQLKEFTTGSPYDITDRQFVVRRAFRLNDWLPEDEGKPHKFTWQRGGWLLVDGSAGRITQLRLPDFDPFYSDAIWYRDYAAYCGMSESGEKLLAVVFQLGRRKPLLSKPLRAANGGGLPESECAAPQWQRQPVRVTFQPVGSPKVTFSIRSYSGDPMTGTNAETNDDVEVKQE